MNKNNIYNIQSSYNFLESLSFLILNKYQNPSDLSKLTILLPTRRSCREIKKILLKQSKQKALILPKIKAIGDIDSDEFDLDYLTNNDFSNSLPCPMKYNLLLIEEIEKWNNQIGLFGKNINSDQIAAIALKLKNFLDEATKEEIDLNKIDEVDDAELSEHKQKILKFLKYFGAVWQNDLNKNNITSTAKYYNEIINFISKNKEKTSFFKDPIIIAGSTGSIKATANLIKIIADDQNNSVILFGLDTDLKEQNWNLITEFHPQFILKNLLQFLGISRNQVQNLEFKQFEQSNLKRRKLTSYSTIPAEKTDSWINIDDLDESAISNLSLIEARNDFDEAKIIAIIMRETLEKNDKNCALISNDQGLCKMVKAILQKWEINVDDSHNNNLEDSKIVNYFLGIGTLFEDDFSSINLLSILKNPATKIDPENLKNLELEILRKINGKKDLEFLDKKLNQSWFSQLKLTLKPFSDLFKKEKTSLENLIKANIKCAEKLSENSFYKLEGAAEFIEFIEEILSEKITKSFLVDVKNYSSFIKKLMANYKFIKEEEFHPRLHILSTVEARLMNYDLVIISGLNEGDFPDNNSKNAWLGRRICLDLGFSDSNKKIGISAYDFNNYLGNKEIIITRSFNKNNSPTIKSRFLLKLEAVLQATNLYNQIDLGKHYHQILTAISNVDKKENITAPKPKPKIEDRLTKFSVTDIGKWIRDPYYIYAKRILKLKPLEVIDKEPSFAEFGNFIHKTLENFIKDYEEFDSYSKKIDTLINKYGKEAFKLYFPDDESKLLWWPKFENIAKWFVKNEEEIRKNLKTSYTELEANLFINGVNITTKIDRVNFYQNGEIEIIDYKTGIVPGIGEIKLGLEPQLSMEAIILSEGEIKNYPELKNIIPINKINLLNYYNLKGRDKSKINSVEPAQDLIFSAKDGIIKLITLFSSKEMIYISCPNPDIYKENDYCHLARVFEFSN